jgi:hypothetical protein
VSSPNTPNDPIKVNGPRPQQGPIPFWDSFAAAFGDAADGSTSNNSLDVWDICVLGGAALPGLAKVTPKARKRFDVKKKKGQDGAGLTFTGYDPSEVTIALRIWTPVQFDTLQSLMGMLKAKSPTGSAQAVAAQLALDINHPGTTLVGIHSVVIESLDGLIDVEPKGVKQMLIHCLEYIPPKQLDVTATTKQSANFTNPTAINVPAAPAQRPSQDSSFTGPEGH